MKTIKLKLLAIIVMAAIAVTAAIPADAQRRNRSDRKESTPARKDNRTLKESVQKRSTFKDYDRRGNNSQRTSEIRERNVKNNIQQKSSKSSPNNYDRNRPTRKSSETVRRPEPSRGFPSNRGYDQQLNERKSDRSVKGDEPRISRNNGSDARNSNRGNLAREHARQSNRNGSVRNDRYKSPDRRGSNISSRESRANSEAHAKTIYNLDKNDRRYRTTDNYKGSKDYWSGKYRSGNKHHKNDWSFYRNYNYKKYNHWNHRWERYRWNHYSWIDYYNGYHPHSYRYHRHYYHHPRFGHVIKRFLHRPVVFFHGNHRYYCFDGHFFRYRRGVGYVLVDIPFGMTFSYLPSDYERVYINGYLYFRVGNLFFEYSEYGFKLVHYPERYFAYNDGFYHDGYIFEDMY